MKARTPVSDLIRDQVRRGRTVRLIVRGWSMVPLVWPGFRLTLASWPDEGPRVGDIAAIMLRGHAVFHLVHYVERSGGATVLRTRGLANLWADPPTREPEWIGRAVRVEWGPLSVRTDHPLFRVLRVACGPAGQLMGLVRLAYLRGRVLAVCAMDRPDNSRVS